MGDFNKVMILGRLTRDPEVRFTPNGTPVCDIGLAVGRRVGGGESGMERREETTYIDVTLWNRQAELAGQYLAKGRELFVEGRLTLDSWDDKTTGQKRTKLKVVCENMQFIGGGGGGGGQRPAPQQQQQQQGGYGNNAGYAAPAAPQQPAYQQEPPAYQQQPAPQQAPMAQPAPMEPQFEPEEDDDIPF